MLLQEPGHRHQHVFLYLQTTKTAFTLNNRSLTPPPPQPRTHLTTAALSARTYLTNAALSQEDEVLPLAVPNGGLVEGKEGGAGRTELGRVLEEMK